MRAERNEVQDQSSLIARYQKEVAGLRAHLQRVGTSGTHDPMDPEVRLSIRPVVLHGCGAGEQSVYCRSRRSACVL